MVRTSLRGIYTHGIARLTAFASGAFAALSLAACATSFALSHPNFDHARNALNDAINRVRDAQQVNGPNFGGHAARAIELMREVSNENSIADEYHRGIR
jgi:hypothetical protein